eukprot:7630670-Pyramimonas_sp.AAC.1
MYDAVTAPRVSHSRALRLYVKKVQRLFCAMARIEPPAMHCESYTHVCDGGERATRVSLVSYVRAVDVLRVGEWRKQAEEGRREEG